MLSRRAATWLLFAAAALALPLPYYLGEVEHAPLLRLAFFNGIFGMVFLAEGWHGMTGLFFGLGLIQLIAYALLLRAGAGLVVRGIQRVRMPLRGVLLVGIVLLLIGSSLRPLYDTPLSSSRPRSNLFGLFE